MSLPYFFREDGLLKKLNLDRVVFLEAAKNYTRFNSLDGDFLVRISLDAAMKLLPENKFLQVHRSFAVSIDHISNVGRDSVFFTDFPKLEIPISRPYYVQLTKLVVIHDSAATDQEELPEKMEKAKRKENKATRQRVKSEVGSKR